MITSDPKAVGHVSHARCVVNWETFRPERVDADVVSIVRATCLLESRSAMYSDYLKRVLPARFASEIAAWAEEEQHHGRALRRWLRLADPGFDFDDAYRRFSELPYHDGEVDPRRGGVSEELLARCVVEAFASGYYYALRDFTVEPLLTRLCSRLMADERRHFGMFATMLATTPRLTRLQRARVIMARAIELSDDQVMFAAHCANHVGPYDRRAVRGDHLRRMVSMHQSRHLSYIAKLLGETLSTASRCQSLA